MPQLLTKSLSWLKTNSQARKTFDEAELRALGESLKVKQLQPVLTQPDGTIIAGERRYRAALLVGLGTLEVKIADEQLDPIQIKAWQFVENELREDLKAIEKVDAVAEFAALNLEWTGKEIAGHLHISPVEISKMLAIARCPVAHGALADGRLKGISDAYQIAKAEPEAKSGLLALRAGGATRDEITRKARERKTEPETVKYDRIVHPLSTGTKIVVTGEAMTLAGYVEALSAALEVARKSLKESLDVKTAMAVWSDRAKAKP